jgi:murein DD-endopeptidase MepM/ murein hydrolase activator NlpD
MAKLFSMVLFLICACAIYSQDIKLIGELKPANLIVGIGENIEMVQLNDKPIFVDDGKYFTFGFDRNSSGEYLLKIKIKDSKVILNKILLPERKYKVQKINNMKKSLVTAPKSQNDRLVRERKISREARERIGEIGDALYKDGFIKPVKTNRVTSVFGSQRVLNGVAKNPHNGLDYGAPRGTPVYAMTDGFVQLAADTFYYSGNYILLDHGQGLNSFYLHLSKKNVKEGDWVKKGDKIGEIGTTGRSTGPHLHWGVQWYSKRIDPACLLKMEKFN